MVLTEGQLRRLGIATEMSIKSNFCEANNAQPLSGHALAALKATRLPLPSEAAAQPQRICSFRSGSRIARQGEDTWPKSERREVQEHGTLLHICQCFFCYHHCPGKIGVSATKQRLDYLRHAQGHDLGNTELTGETSADSGDASSQMEAPHGIAVRYPVKPKA